jgi:HD-GYP domain-containing protein (c-di-GMP phosphodiesterase class II)/DNA-binding CsgD family transcriptional regulator
MTARDLRLADLLVAISVATDLGMGYAPEKAIRSCLLATGLARGLDLAEEDVRDVYLTTLLRHLGCTATAHEEAYLFGGDELQSRPAAERTDFDNARELLRLTLGTGRGSGLNRPRYLARTLRSGKKGGERIFRAICEVASHLAERLGLGGGVKKALYQVMERWDGTGSPEGLAGDDIAVPARIAEVATQAVIFDRAGGPDAAVAMVAQRAGGWFDPTIAESFRRLGPDLLAGIAAGDPWAAVLEAEPEPIGLVGPADLDRVARTFADMVDLKSPYTLGHSSGVAQIAVAAARTQGLPDRDVLDLRRAALLHDVGRTAVSSGIWDKPGLLTAAEWESVRLHPYHTERILARSKALAPLMQIAGRHHERQDGSGYHHGASGAEIPTAARLLAAADAYQAMTQERPHRRALSAEEAAETIGSDASAGLLDPDCARAVVEAAGHTEVRVRAAWPAGLSDREIEVLRLMAAGMSNRGIAKRLFISPRTAEHHVQHIYTKIGTSTRASAAVFAMAHDLLRP